MVLLYQVENMPSFPALQAAMAVHRLSYRLVRPDEYMLSLEQLAAGQTPQTPSLPSDDIQEPMMVFCGMAAEEVSSFIDFMRRLGVGPIGLKAVLTPTNRSWTSLQLYRELRREHAFFKRADSKQTNQ